jgi:2-polyprenyl-3-methyl-5-hydroxy-6-metoxy-1,4-benzoquinol methylase
MPTKECKLCSSSLKLVINDIFDTRFGLDPLFDIAFCPSCHLGQTFPLPHFNELKTLYENYYNYAGTNNGIYSKVRSTFLSSPFYRLWMILDGDISFHSVLGKGRLLDLGCNEGRGLGIYKKNGFEPQGLELNEKAAVKARNSGFKVFTGPLEEFQPKQLYDVVVLSNVLEHSLDPKKMLSDVSRLLRKGGQIWLSCPNFNSWQRKVFGKYWINWHVPFHLFHFSKHSLIKILEENGFEAQKVSQFSPALWFAQTIISSLLAKKGRPTSRMRDPILIALLILFFRTVLFPILCIGNLLNRGDSLVVVANKL